MKGWRASLIKSGWLVHSIRTALAASGSFVFARLFELPEPYWAAVTTIVVMQSTLGAAWKVSVRRFIGTAMGAAVGGLVASFYVTTPLLFALMLFLMGIVCALLRLDPSAYRFAGITFAIVALVNHEKSPAAVIAFHRFAEVCIGILVALVLTGIWSAKDVSAK